MLFVSIKHLWLLGLRTDYLPRVWHTSLFFSQQQQQQQQRNQVAMASFLLAMASNLIAMASNLLILAGTLHLCIGRSAERSAGIRAFAVPRHG